MPVYNARPYLDEAVRSILDQTFREFEFVIFDDGSTDGSTERLREWAARDRRIRLFEGSSNLGPVKSSNRVMEIAAGELIARMDADDVCHPERLARQVQLLRERPDVNLVATSCDIIDAEGRRVREPDVWRLTRRSWYAPFAHGSVMFRRRVYDRLGGYRPECELWEDQDLFVRMLACTDGRIVTLSDPLYRIRHSRVSTRVSSDQERIEQAVDLAYRAVDRLNQGKWYDDLLNERPDRERLDPRVFISVGSLELWANGRPRLFRRFLRRSRVTWRFGWLAAFVWTLWATTSPGTLRAFMKILVRCRNLAASHGEVAAAYEWLPPCQAAPCPIESRERRVQADAVAGE